MIRNCLIIGLMLCFIQSFGQSTNQHQPFVKKINDYLNNSPQEKLHLHLDKQIYRPTDTIWFQAYAVNAVDHKPSERSVFLYAELINTKDSICKSLQFPINFGFSMGDIPLSDQFPSGLYRLRAYTSSMKNSGGKFLFNKLVCIADELSENNSIAYRQSIDYKPSFDSLKNDAGYKLNLDNTKLDSLYLTISTDTELLNKEEVTLVPLSNGKPLFIFKTKMTEQEIHLTIPKNKMPDGIINFSLLNANDLIIDQKMAFNPVKESGILTLNDLAPIYKKKENVTVNLDVKNWLGKPLIGSFSISVTNADVVPFIEKNESTIYGNLLLNADFENGIDYANYYLSKPVELDNILLSKNWERPLFSNSKWESKTNTNHLAELSGKVVDEKQRFIQGAEITLFPAELGSGNIMSTVSDSAGLFRFGIPDSLIYGSFIVKAKTKKFKELIIELDKDNPLIVKPFKRYLLDSVNTPKQKKIVTLKNQKGKPLINKDGINLKDVEIRDYNPKPKLINSHSFNLNGPGQADKVFTEKDLEHEIDWTILLRVSGIRFTGAIRGGLPFAGSNIYSSRGAPGVPMLILVDGVASSLPAIHDVESIEILKDVAYSGIYGIRGAGGVIVITTKKGDGKYNSTTSQNIVTYKFPLSKADIFNTNDRDDAGSTLFWKPDLITDKNGKASFSFKNNDVAGNYRMIIEGISTSGILFRKEYFYRVE